MHLSFIANNRFLEIKSATSVELAQLKLISTASEYNFRLKSMDKLCLLHENLYLPGGLWKTILDLRDKNYDVKIDNLVDSLISKVDAVDFQNWLSKLDLTFEPYEYQVQTVHKALQVKISKYELAPGAGKTLIIYLICRYLLEHDQAKRILIVVPSTTLVEQMPDNFDGYVEQEPTLQVSKWMGGVKLDLSANVVVANIDIIEVLVKARKTYLAILDLLKTKTNNRRTEFDAINSLKLASLGGCSVRAQSDEDLKLILHNLSTVYKTEKNTRKKNVYANSIKAIQKLLNSQTIDDCKKLVTDLLEIDYSKLANVARALYERISIFNAFDTCIMDECHKMKTNQHEGLVKALDKSVCNRLIGLSGTLPSIKTMDGLKIESYLGPTMHRVTHAELEELGTVAKVAIKSIVVELPENDVIKYFCNEDADELSKKYHLEQSVVRSSSSYLKMVRAIAKQNSYNQILMFTSIGFAKEAYKLFTETLLDKKVYLIIGEIPVEERRRICKLLETEDDCIVIANYQVMDLGLSINNVGGIHFVNTCKSFYRVRQSIGRAIRLHPNLPVANIFDYVIRFRRYDKSWPFGGDRTENSLYRHGQARKNIYKEQKMAYVEKSLNSQAVLALASLT